MLTDKETINELGAEAQIRKMKLDLVPRTELEKEVVELRKKNFWYEKKYGTYIEKRGSHNWKNLFKKPNLQEWTILFMIIMALFMVWAYQHDISSCQSALTNLSERFNVGASQNANLSKIFDSNVSISDFSNVNPVQNKIIKEGNLNASKG